jgi:hypothetical protein
VVQAVLVVEVVVATPLLRLLMVLLVQPTLEAVEAAVVMTVPRVSAMVLLVVQAL